MNLKDFYKKFSKKQREKFILSNATGQTDSIICVWSPIKKRILYWNNLMNSRIAGLNSKFYVNLEIITYDIFDKYKIMEKETIKRLFEKG